MSTTPDTPVTTLAEMMDLLRRTPQGSLPLDAIQCLEQLVRKLGYDERWITADGATKILGITLPAVVPFLAQRGLLRSRKGTEGNLDVRLVDVLHERLVTESLLAIGGDELTEEELAIMNAARPGTNPWEREAR